MAFKQLSTITPISKNVGIHTGILIGYYILFQAFYNMIESKTLWPYESFTQFGTYFFLNFIPITITYAFDYAIIFSWKTYSSPLKKLTIEVVVSFIGMVILNLLFILIVSQIAPQHTKINWAGTIFNNIFILLGMEITYYVKSHIRQIQEISENKQKMLQYRYEALHAQIDPHFLFNTLNILYALVGKDTNKARLFILSLSNIYRYVLNQQGKEKVSLDNEFSFCQEYARILMLRYDNHFAVATNELPEQQHHIVPFTLQLLIENAVKHNKVNINSPMTVNINFSNDHLTVSNPINPKRAINTHHKGLDYLRKLYAAYGKQVEILNDHKTFTIIIQYLD